MTIRRGVKDLNQWTNNFSNPIHPAPYNNNINEFNNNITSSLLTAYNTIFPESQIGQIEFGKQIFTTNEYSHLKGNKRNIYVCRKIVYNYINRDVCPHQFNELSRQIDRISKCNNTNIRTLYTSETLHTLENKACNKIRAYIRKAIQTKIKTTINKILANLDKDGHQLIKLLHGSNNPRIACLFQSNKAYNNENEIDELVTNTWSEIFKSSTLEPKR